MLHTFKGLSAKYSKRKKEKHFFVLLQKKSPHWGSGYFGYENMTLMDKVEVNMKKKSLISYFHIVF